MARNRKKQRRPKLVQPRGGGLATAIVGGTLSLTPEREILGTHDDLMIDRLGRPARWLQAWRRTWTDYRVAFLVGRGWSATPDRWRAIADSGLPAMAINDVPDGITPRMWCTGDPPHYFRRDIWLNPSVAKFCPIEYADMHLPRLSAYGPENQKRCEDAPNVHFFHKSVNDDPQYFLDTPWMSWGTLSFGPNTPHCDTDFGVRSSMLVGLRTLHYLGFRTVFLLGVDFTPHEHPDPEYYLCLSRQLAALRRTFDAYGYNVYNTSPDSHLRVFDFVDFNDAVNPQNARE